MLQYIPQDERARIATTIESPIGDLWLESDGDALVALFTQGHTALAHRLVRSGECSVLRAARAQLEEWFDGARSEFDLPLRPGGTAFEVQVWNALVAIPFGATTSYGALAARLGRPTAARAVGAANARNPISIIVPCHRVIAADGSLTGYAGGVERKRWLLAHEAGVVRRAQRVREKVR